MCHSYQLSLYNQTNLTIFDKGKTLPWEGERKIHISVNFTITGWPSLWFYFILFYFILLFLIRSYSSNIVRRCRTFSVMFQWLMFVGVIISVMYKFFDHIHSVILNRSNENSSKWIVPLKKSDFRFLKNQWAMKKVFRNVCNKDHQTSACKSRRNFMLTIVWKLLLN